LLILINPLVEVSLQEVNLLRIFQEPRPELLLQFLLSQNQLNVFGGVVNLALLLINLGVELELDMVISLEGVRVTRECETLWLEAQLQVGRFDIRYRDGEIDEVLCGIGFV
jgi:hypothetical protein